MFRIVGHSATIARWSPDDKKPVQELLFPDEVISSGRIATCQVRSEGQGSAPRIPRTCYKCERGDEVE